MLRLLYWIYDAANFAGCCKTANGTVCKLWTEVFLLMNLREGFGCRSNNYFIVIYSIIIKIFLIKLYCSYNYTFFFIPWIVKNRKYNIVPIWFLPKGLVKSYARRFICLFLVTRSIGSEFYLPIFILGLEVSQTLLDYHAIHLFTYACILCLN